MACFILLFAIVFFVILQKNVNAKEAELKALQGELQELQEENSEVDYLINEADDAELYEHLARERGYVYPDEKIYYNVTPGK
jgi:cell division protein FtsB